MGIVTRGHVIVDNILIRLLSLRDLMDGVGDDGVSSGSPQRHLGLFTGTTGLGEVAGEAILVLKGKFKDILIMSIGSNVIFLH